MKSLEILRSLEKDPAILEKNSWVLLTMDPTKTEKYSMDQIKKLLAAGYVRIDRQNSDKIVMISRKGKEKIGLVPKIKSIYPLAYMNKLPEYPNFKDIKRLANKPVYNPFSTNNFVYSPEATSPQKAWTLGLKTSRTYEKENWPGGMAEPIAIVYTEDYKRDQLLFRAVVSRYYSDS